MSLTNSQGPKCCLSQNLNGGMGKMKKWMAVFLGVSLMALLMPAGLRAQAAATGETISAETASTLPLSTRNFLTLLTLSAGANTELFDSAALGRGQVTINVNGQRPTNNNFQLE